MRLGGRNVQGNKEHQWPREAEVHYNGLRVKLGDEAMGLADKFESEVKLDGCVRNRGVQRGLC